MDRHRRRRRSTEHLHGPLDERRAKRAEADAARRHREEESAQAAEAPSSRRHPDSDADRSMPEHVSESGRRDYAPRGHSGATGWWATAVRLYREFNENALLDHAAALTYYGLLSLFPGLLALVSILGVFGDPAKTTDTLLQIIENLSPGSASDTFSGPIRSLTENRSTAGVLLIFGLATALWSASGYIGAFIRASNVIYETPEGRPFWKLRPLQLLITLLMVLSLAATLLALVFTGPVVDAVAGPLGLSTAAVDVWNIAKWPALVFVVLVMLAVLYFVSPNVRLPKFRLITPGAVLALVLWVVASLAFAFYVANFGSYDKTYGTLGGMISLLVWLWISNIALLLGAQFNAELERNRELDAGVPDAAREIQLDAREGPNRRNTT